MPFEEWVEHRVQAPDFDPTLWFIVRDGDEIAAALRGEPDRGGAGWVGAIGVRKPWRKRGLGLALLLHAFGEFYRRGQPRIGLGVDAQNPTGATRLYERAGHARRLRGGCVREGARVSRLRAKCPDCKTYTAVALGPEYECHSCGRGFGAGLVRVPQAWGDGGEAMAEAAWLELPYPETAVIEAETLEEQNLALAADLPEAPAHPRRLLLFAHRRRRGSRCAGRIASQSSGSTRTATSTRWRARRPGIPGRCPCAG